MTETGAFLVEDFVHSIAAQLDRVQDALRLKAVNRPLTYALKDFSLDLNVFADVDAEGQVRFRTAGPNETGASTVRIAFTTITRPMIEENTISLQAAQGATLDETGLDPEEQRRLERLGVRNVAQLQKLQKQAGASTIQRIARVPADRLRQALVRGRPTIDRVAVAPPATKPAPSVPTPKPAPARPPSPVPTRPVTKPAPKPVLAPEPGVRVRLEGRNLLGGGLPRAKFDGVPVPIASIDDDLIEIEVPAAAGSLTLDLDHGDVREIMLPDPTPHAAGAFDDPWGQS